MDGLSQHGHQQKPENLIRDEDCEIEALAQNIKTTKVQTNKKEGKSMNFLSSNIKLKRTTEAKERVFNEEVPLSFAGLFSKPSETKLLPISKLLKVINIAQEKKAGEKKKPGGK